MTEKEKLSSPFSIENLLSTTAAKKGAPREDAPKEKNSSHLQSLKRKYIQELTGIFFIFKKQLCLLLSLWITVLAKYIFSGIEIRILMSLQNTKFTSLVFVKTPPKKGGGEQTIFCDECWSQFDCQIIMLCLTLLSFVYSWKETFQIILKYTKKNLFF